MAYVFSDSEECALLMHYTIRAFTVVRPELSLTPEFLVQPIARAMGWEALEDAFAPPRGGTKRFYDARYSFSADAASIAFRLVQTINGLLRNRLSPTESADLVRLTTQAVYAAWSDTQLPEPVRQIRIGEIDAPLDNEHCFQTAFENLKQGAILPSVSLAKGEDTQFSRIPEFVDPKKRNAFRSQDWFDRVRFWLDSKQAWGALLVIPGEATPSGKIHILDRDAEGPPNGLFIGSYTNTVNLGFLFFTETKDIPALEFPDYSPFSPFSAIAPETLLEIIHPGITGRIH